MSDERTKMTNGLPYNQFDEELISRRVFVRKQLQEANNTPDNNQRNGIIQALLKQSGKRFFVETGVEFDYGFNISLGDNFYANYRLTLLDSAPITIGKNCYFGPDTGLYTNIHPLNARDRIADVEMSAPITIGDNAWTGGHVTILPGVTLGDNVVVGAGSVVTKSFGDNVVLVGNPAKVLKTIDNAEDSVEEPAIDVIS